jgi:hypothetical protein
VKIENSPGAGFAGWSVGYELKNCEVTSVSGPAFLEMVKIMPGDAEENYASVSPDLLSSGENYEQKVAIVKNGNQFKFFPAVDEFDKKYAVNIKIDDYTLAHSQNNIYQNGPWLVAQPQAKMMLPIFDGLQDTLDTNSDGLSGWKTATAGKKIIKQDKNGIMIFQLSYVSMIDVDMDDHPDAYLASREETSFEIVGGTDGSKNILSGFNDATNFIDRINMGTGEMKGENEAGNGYMVMTGRNGTFMAFNPDKPQADANGNFTVKSVPLATHSVIGNIMGKLISKLNSTELVQIMITNEQGTDLKNLVTAIGLENVVKALGTTITIPENKNVSLPTAEELRTTFANINIAKVPFVPYNCLPDTMKTAFWDDLVNKTEVATGVFEYYTNLQMKMEGTGVFNMTFRLF